MVGDHPFSLYAAAAEPFARTIAVAQHHNLQVGVPHQLEEQWEPAAKGLDARADLRAAQAARPIGSDQRILSPKERSEQRQLRTFALVYLARFEKFVDGFSERLVLEIARSLTSSSPSLNSSSIMMAVSDSSEAKNLSNSNRNL